MEKSPIAYHRVCIFGIIPVIVLMGGFFSCTGYHPDLGNPHVQETPVGWIAEFYHPVSVRRGEALWIEDTSVPTLQSAVTKPTAAATLETVQARISYYWPPFGGINCDFECSHVANGDRWEDWVDKGLACPMNYPLGTIFVVHREAWKCVDRGEAIVINEDGSIWLDLLTSEMPYNLAWGSTLDVAVIRP